MACKMSTFEDNAVKYLLFPKLSCKNSSISCDNTPEDILESYFVKLSPFLNQYIWQDEPFSLKIVSEDKEMPPHFRGQTHFGDNVEDEWFIVFLLLHLSKEDSDLVVKISDSDGEFILIESADFLPKWLNPESSENRVYIHKGKIHIIPIATSPGDLTFLPCGTPSIADALSTVRAQSSLTTALASIQNAILKRLDGYPEKIAQLRHRTHCYVPATVATILKHDPSLVSMAVQAFYQRDPLDLKACRMMKYFPPETRIMSEVVFTRCLYAQLTQQDYKPDRKVGWNVPARNSSDFLPHDLGMKLACGFEILTASVKKDYSTELEVFDLINDARWTRFLKSLKDKDYFRGELEGSRMYVHLLEQAKRFFCQTVSNADFVPSAGAKILQLLHTLEVDYDKLKEDELNMRPPDSDDWMNISECDLESYFKLKENGQKDTRGSAQIGDAVLCGLNSFLDHQSGLEGVVAPKKKNHESINFDADNFGDSMQNILDFKGLETDSDTSSSMTGYSSDEATNDDLHFEENVAQKPVEFMEEMKQYMDQMDKELAKTAVGQSFERETAPKEEDRNDIDDELDDFQPVDIDLTALKNILQSYESQHGLPGPASSLLASMGISLPENSDS